MLYLWKQITMNKIFSWACLACKGEVSKKPTCKSLLQSIVSFWNFEFPIWVWRKRCVNFFFYERSLIFAARCTFRILLKKSLKFWMIIFFGKFWSWKNWLISTKTELVRFMFSFSYIVIDINSIYFYAWILKKGPNVKIH